MEPTIHSDLISVVIPVYNAASYLIGTLESVIRQSYRDWEIVAVNDGSTDASEAILRTYSEQYPNKIRYETIQNTGSARYPRLRAVELSRGQWVCNIDADDYIEIDYLSKLHTLAQTTKAEIVSPTMLYTDSQGKTTQVVPCNSLLANTVHSARDAAALTFERGAASEIACNGLLTRRDIFVGLLEDVNQSLRYIYQDEVDFLQLLLRANTIAISDAKYYYRMNPTSVTHTPSAKRYDKLITEVEFQRIALEYFSGDEVRCRQIHRRFLQVLKGRRFRYLRDKTSLSTPDIELLESYFLTAYKHLSRRRSNYVLLDYLLFVAWGYTGFIINCRLNYEYSKLFHKA